MNFQKKEPVIIVGCGQSGTSLLCEVLSECGLRLGNDLGVHGEATFFQELNKWLLRGAGARWDHPEAFDYFLSSNERINVAAEYIKDVIGSPRLVKYCGVCPYVYSDHPFWDLWGWKDPRNAVTLPIWSRIFPNAYFVHIKRHGIDVSDSFRRKNSKTRSRKIKKYKYYRNLIGSFLGIKIKRSSFEHSPRCGNRRSAFRLWVSYMERIRKYRKKITQRGGSFHELRFEDLLLDTKKTVENLSQFLGISTEKNNASQFRFIDESRAFVYCKDDFQDSEEYYSKNLKRFGYS